MNHLIVYAHSRPDSFNAAIRDTVRSALERLGDTVVVRDLHSTGFRPVLTAEEIAGFYEGRYPDDIAEEQEHIRRADAIHFVFPTYWYAMPAILKGYVDRVFSTGFAFRYTKEGPVGLLHGKKAAVYQTAADPEQSLRETGRIGAMEKTIDDAVLRYCGLEVVAHHYFHSAHHIGKEGIERYLSEAATTAEKTAGRAYSA